MIKLEIYDPRILSAKIVYDIRYISIQDRIIYMIVYLTT